MDTRFSYRLGRLLGWLLRGWRRTLRRTVRNREARTHRCILTCWHGRLPGSVLDVVDAGMVSMASLSSDGALAAGAVEVLGISPTRGSTSRGGRAALVAMKEALAGGAPLAGLTVDGPRGPWRRTHPGAIALARKLKLPVVPISASSRPAWMLRSWDRMLVPPPFSRLLIIYGEPIPPEALAGDVDAACRLVDAGIDRVTLEADLELHGRPLWPELVEEP